jgi:alpha-ketoglutarate-dependent taurine dioxygenase
LQESPAEGYSFIYDPVYVDYSKMSQREEIVFKDFFKSVESATFNLSMNEGQVLFIDNYKCAHGRPRFSPGYDGTDRWLKRVQISKDVSKHLDREYSLDIITDI